MFELLLSIPIYVTQVPKCYITDATGRIFDLSALVCGIKAPRKYCKDYINQKEAQLAFNSNAPGTQYLDGDGDKVVCEWGTQSDLKKAKE